MNDKGDVRSLSLEAQEAIRMRAVDAVLAGMSQVKAAEVFGVTTRAVSNWMRAYRQEGKKALKGSRRGRPPGGRLQPWQCATIVNLITDHHPDQLKLPFYLWTREAVRDLIQRRFGIRYSIRHVGRYLSRWGFTVQKPARKAFEQCPARVRAWLESEYPQIRARAKAEGAEIQWGDETGIRSDAPGGRCYSPKGKTPIVPTPAKRFGCNMISSVSNQGTLRFMVFTETFTAEVMITFLKRLIKQTRRNVFLIVDGHPVHRSASVKAFVNKRNDEIQIFRLPPYSPELNPDEMVNQDMKTNAVARKRARTQPEMMGNVRSYLWSRQRQPELVKRYFDAPTVRYAAA